MGIYLDRMEEKEDCAKLIPKTAFKRRRKKRL